MGICFGSSQSKMCKLLVYIFILSIPLPHVSKALRCGELLELPFGGSAIPFETALGTGPAPKDPWPATATFDTCDTRRDSR